MSFLIGEEKKCKRRDAGLSTTGAVFGFLVVIIIGAFAYLQFGENVSGEAPTIDDVMTAHQSVDSLQYDAKLSADADIDSEAMQARDDSQQLQQSLRYIPGLDTSSGFPDTLQGELSISGSGAVADSGTRSEGSLSLSVGADELSDVLAIQWRKVDGMNYLRGETLPDISFFQLSQYEGQWYSASSSQATDSLGSFSGGSVANVDNANISATTTKEIANALFNKDLLSVDNRTRTELRSGEPAWQIDMSINPDAVGDFQKEVSRIIRENHPDIAESQDIEPTDAEIEEARSSLEELNNQLDQFSVWIDGDTNRLRRIVLKSDVTESEMSDLKAENDEYEGVTSATFTFDVGMSAYNESVNIETPSDATPLQEAFGMQLSPGGGSGMPSGGSFGPGAQQSPQGVNQQEVNY